MDIGINIRKIREAKGLSQKEVALAIEVAATQYSRLENGKSEPTLKTLLKVSKVLDVNLDTLVTGQNDSLKEDDIKDKPFLEKVKLVENLPEEEKNAVLTVIDMAITKQKFKTFFQENLVSA